MRYILALFLLWCLPAHAGSVTITVIGTECVGTACQASFPAIPNAIITRYINAHKILLGKVKVDPACSIEPCALRDLTAAEVVKRWAKDIVQGTINNTVNNERANASKTASDAIVDVVIPDPN